MRFCLNYVPLFSLAQNRAWWQACEKAGIERIGFGDTPALGRELYVTLAACALSTERIEIMPSVTNPMSRDPSVTAAALFSLAELAPGRIAAAGFGTGDSAVWGTGLKMASVARLRSYLLAVKGLLRGDEVEYDGRRFLAVWAQKGPPTEIPLYVACAGPRVLRMGAQVADGLIISMGFAAENVASVNQIISDACNEVGRDPGELSIWWNAPVHVAASRDAALEAGVNLGASWLTAGGMDGKQIPEELRGRLVEFTRDAQDLAFIYKTPNRNKVLTDRARELGLLDWLVERTPQLWGTPSDIASRLKEFDRQGMSNWIFNLGGVGIDPIAVIDALTNDIIPAL